MAEKTAVTMVSSMVASRAARLVVMMVEKMAALKAVSMAASTAD